jgi:putative addiction module component (TIGR02574 family)
MSMSQEELFKSALALPEGERILLATELLDSIESPPTQFSVDDPGFLEELERRANDSSPGIPWEEVKRRMESKLGR